MLVVTKVPNHTLGLLETLLPPSSSQNRTSQLRQKKNNRMAQSQLRESLTTVDRISDFSDEILLHILSFLPTKDAFITTFLSKRWNPLCYSLTTFCFDYQTIPYNEDAFNRFTLFIDNLMLSPRLANQSLKTFHLKCLFVPTPPSLSTWVEAAKRRRIQELHLFLNNVPVNPTIFTSHTLVVLKLSILRVVTENLCVDLPSLKTLELMHVCFQSQNDIKKILNASPNLQDLHTSHPIYVRPEKEKFTSLILSKLVRADINSTDVPFEPISNVEFLRLHRAQDPSVHLHRNMDDFFKRIPVFQNLIHVELFFPGFFHGWDGFLDFLQHCPKLQILYISKWNCSSSKDWDCPIWSVECVSSHLRLCTIVHFQGSKNDLRFATYILQNARCLEMMTIYVTARSSNGTQKDQIIEELSTCPRMSLECKLSLQFC